MAHWRLKITAAQFALGLANTDELIDSAHNALDDSVYSYSLGELATFRNPTWADCFPLFVAAMKELQTPIPDHADAVMTLLEYHVIRLVEGTTVPTEALNDLYLIESTVTSHNWNSREKIPTVAVEPLAPFIEKYYAVEEFQGYQSYREEQSLPPLDRAELEKLHAEVTSLAVNWLSERWGSAVSPNWLTSTVLALATGIHEDKAFERMPILADALQDAGCDNEGFLNHCRQAREHVRGCYVVNILLGKV